MEIDWSMVKKTTLWQYEELLGKMLAAFSYPFVGEYYNFTPRAASAYAGQLKKNVIKPGQGGFIDNIQESFELIQANGIEYTLALLRLVESRQDCVEFLAKTGMPFDKLLGVLNFLFRWVLPSRFSLREIAPDESVKRLAGVMIKTNLDLLERGRTPEGRADLAGETGLGLEDLLNLVNLADIARLPWVRGKTVLHLAGGGFGNLECLAGTELQQLEAGMEAYYRMLGKTMADFQAVIPLQYMRGGAQILPRVVV